MARFTASVSTSTSSDEITGHEGGSGAPQTDSFQVLVDLYDFSLSDFRKKSADMDKSGMLQELFALHPLCMAVFISPKSKGLDIELPPILPADDDQGIENASIGSATAANDENARKRTMSAKRDAAIENEQARKETRRINDALVELRSQIPDVHVPQSCHKDWKNMTSAATYIRCVLIQLFILLLLILSQRVSRTIRTDRPCSPHHCQTNKCSVFVFLRQSQKCPGSSSRSRSCSFHAWEEGY